MLLKGLIIATLLFVGCLPARSSSYTITNNNGGSVVHFINAVKYARQAQVLIKLNGYCASSCTLFTNLPAPLLCAHPDTILMFHLPSGPDAEVTHKALQVMWNIYPGWVRKWIMDVGGLSHEFKTMPYDYVRQYVRRCP